ncbi:MAG TPA: DUF2059 domain-containing protein [Thermodesulfobacteriota bacterium]|nr:DUF2059 domain-containing protein [Thermodesulfobacteriota bacterium]
MKLLFILILSAFLSVQLSKRLAADDTSHRKAVEEMFTVMNMESFSSKLIDQMLQMQLQRNPELEPYKGTLQVFFNKYVGWASMKDEMVQNYKEAFTEQEIKEITAFYKTPTGQKVLQKMPELMAKGAQLGVSRVQNNIGELEEMLKKEMEKQNKTKNEP